MENRKKKQSIADEINETLKPKELTEENDDIEARFEEFDENISGFNEVSSIRRQNVKELSELDSRYEGKAVSRKELELDDGDMSENESEAEYSENSDESEGTDSSQDDSEEDLGDIDLSHFTKDSTEQADNPVLLNEAAEEVQKGICVQNQLKMWEKLLEVRIKAQKMLISANSLPDYDAHIALDDSEFLEKSESTCDNVYALMDNLLELQSTLVERFPESEDVLKESLKRKSEATNGSIIKRSRLAEYADVIGDNYDSYKVFGQQALQKWHDRTKSLRDLKNAAMNQSIVHKIESALLGKKEMIRKTQIYRGDYEIFGIAKPQNDSGEMELAEIFDDSDFYHQLLRELIEHKSNVGDNQSEITQKFIELQKVRSKMKKRVETRASKGRKIRYNVHNKLVNFMPPKDRGEWTDEAKTELFNSLFK